MNNTITLAIGADHRGFLLKKFLLTQSSFGQHNVQWVDCGCSSLERTDYPIYAQAVCSMVLAHQAERGILLCGNGIGMSIAANRYPRIYAAVVWNPLIASSAREDDNSNIISIPSDYMTEHETCSTITAWLQSSFKGDRYLQRLYLIDKALSDNRR